MKNLIIVAFSLLLLVSCGGETVTKRTIYNSTDKDVEILLYRDGKTRDTLKFAPEQKREISISTYTEGSDDDADCVFDIDSAWVGIEGGGIFTKKIQDNANWISESAHTKRVPPTYENTCIFRITLDDFE